MVSAKNAGGEAQSIADFAVIQQQPEHMIEVHKTVVFEDVPDFKKEVKNSFSIFSTSLFSIIFTFTLFINFYVAYFPW